MNSRILVVDDDESVRRFLLRTLERRGYVISEAGDASSGRECMSSGAFDLVLCDLRMPGESGLDFVRFLRTEYPETTVIMISGAPQVDSMETALELGASGYLTKPFKPSEVLIGVASALGRDPAPPHESRPRGATRE
jgi:DNA-binding response OmpR family regulator